MKFEQPTVDPSIDFLSEEDQKTFKDQELKTRQGIKERENGNVDGDSSFKCEVCQDSRGGCPSCGWGSNMD